MKNNKKLKAPEIRELFLKYSFIVNKQDIIKFSLYNSH